MANNASARKRARQAEKRRRHNASQRSMARTYIKRVQNAIAKGDQAEAAEALKAAVPVMDKMVGKGHIHRNKAARHKSRMTAQIQKLAS